MTLQNLPQVADRIAANVPAGLARLRTPDLAWMRANRAGIDRQLGVVKRATGGKLVLMSCGLLIILPALFLLVAGGLAKLGVDNSIAGALGGVAVIGFIILCVIAGRTNSKRQENLLGIEQANLSLGYLVSSHHTLQSPGSNAEWATVLTTEDPSLLAHPERMLELAVRTGLASHARQPGVEWFRAVSWINNDRLVDSRGNLRTCVPLPVTVCGNERTWLMSVFVNRDDIPGGYFHESTWLVPLLLVRNPVKNRERQEQIASAVMGGGVKDLAKLAIGEIQRAGERRDVNAAPDRAEIVPVPWWNAEMHANAT